MCQWPEFEEVVNIMNEDIACVGKSTQTQRITISADVHVVVSLQIIKLKIIFTNFFNSENQTSAYGQMCM